MITERQNLNSHVIRDNKLGTDAIYLDFANAFDTVPHNRLKLKLRNAGIRGNVLRWIVSFLNNRSQKVVLPGGSSSWKNVTSSIPQGSILGPLQSDWLMKQVYS
jgi:hypothetical protein